MLSVKRLTVNNFEENTYLIIDEATKECAVVDPGMIKSHELAALDRYIEGNGLKPTQVILTHGHIDHCFGANYVKTKYGVPAKAHTNEQDMLRYLPEQAVRFGLGGIVKEGVEVDVPLNDGDRIAVGESEINVIHIPGHSRGGIVLYDSADGWAIVGDSIFRGSIGRTDLPGGDYDALTENLKSKILTLPPETVLFPGHGEATTVGTESKTNPFLI